MTDLGTLGGDILVGLQIAYGINDSGSVVGYSYIPSGNFLHAFSTAMEVCKTWAPWADRIARLMRSTIRARLTGQAYLPGGAKAHAFLYSGRYMTDLRSFQYLQLRPRDQPLRCGG